MLTSRQFEAIGRLTLAFNEIDETIGVYLPFIVQCPERGVSCLLVKNETFSRRVDFFKNVLDEIAAERPIAVPNIVIVRNLLDQAIEISKRRNHFAHAVAFIDHGKNERMLRTKKGEFPVVEQDIFDLASEAYSVANRLIESCDELAAILASLRAPAGPEDPSENAMGDWEPETGPIGYE